MFKFLIRILMHFGEFLKKRNIINAGIAFIVAIQINKLFTEFIDSIVNPVASKVISNKIAEKTVTIFGVKMKTGKFFLGLFNFMIIMIFIYYIFVLSEEAPSLVSNMYSGFTNLFKSSPKEMKIDMAKILI